MARNGLDSFEIEMARNGLLPNGRIKLARNGLGS